ncbi:hypothetical protein [Demequina aestuarii]|uniref:hypothetical protein n=1 Tax=Demequina aestuarii TaxID=327095 RepID=UPI00128BFFC4|nr:hypothetical protein [Demequina aestuarii]
MLLPGQHARVEPFATRERTGVVDHHGEAILHVIRVGGCDEEGEATECWLLAEWAQAFRRTITINHDADNRAGRTKGHRAPVTECDGLSVTYQG